MRLKRRFLRGISTYRTPQIKKRSSLLLKLKPVIVVLILILPILLSALEPATTYAVADCSVDYVIVNQWNNGFQANLTITNNTATAVQGWNLTWTFGSGQSFNSGWNATFSPSGANMSASNPAGHWNGTIGANGGTVAFGFQGTHSGNVLIPSAFTVNGQSCGGGVTPTPVPTATSTSTPGPSPTPGPTSTPQPATIFRVNPFGDITKNGQLFPMQCGSWFGLEGRHEPSNDPVNPSGAAMELYIGNTTWANGGQGTGRTIQQTMNEIVQLGINVVRFPIAPQTLNPNDPQGQAPNLKNHPSVQVPNSRQALEEFLILADQNNIEVMLDIHSCSNYVGWRAGRLDARPPYVDADRDNYDFTREEYSCAPTGNPSSVTTIQAYGQAQWLADLQTLAGLGDELGVDNIIGIDIFNEPWDYTWQEWNALTELAFEAIDEVNPNILLFVQGISGTAGNQDGTPNTIIQVPHGDMLTNPNWGENLFEAGANPPDIPQDRLVFSPHTYGPSVFVQSMFMDPAQPQCEGLEGDAAGDAGCNIVINPSVLEAG